MLNSGRASEGSYLIRSEINHGSCLKCLRIALFRCSPSEDFQRFARALFNCRDALLDCNRWKRSLWRQKGVRLLAALHASIIVAAQGCCPIHDSTQGISKLLQTSMRHDV